MPVLDPNLNDARNDPCDFRTTHWSVVISAGRTDSVISGPALEKLCRSYWYPLYAFVRRRGYDADDARDLTQGFFEKLLAKNYLAEADAQRGRFRTFLLASLSHFLANEWDKTQRQKRGGGATLLSLDEEDAEGRYLREPVDDSTPETVFDRRWAQAVLERVLERLQREFEANRFEQLKVFLLDPKGTVSYVEVAARLGVSEQSVKTAIHRMRRRYAEIFRDEIAQTVTTSAEVDEEIRHLFAALVD